MELSGPRMRIVRPGRTRLQRQEREEDRLNSSNFRASKIMRSFTMNGYGETVKFAMGSIFPGLGSCASSSNGLTGRGHSDGNTWWAAVGALANFTANETPGQACVGCSGDDTRKYSPPSDRPSQRDNE